MSSLILPNACASRINQVACQNVSRKRSATPRRKVCLISSHPLVLHGFQQALLGSNFAPAPRSLSSTLVPELRQLALPRAPVYVVDAHLPRPSLEALLAGILERFPTARVVVVAEDFTEAHCFALLRLGVKGLISYAQAPQQLPRALPLVAAGGYWVPRPMLSRFVDSVLRSSPGRQLKVTGTSQLSRREQEALDALLENLSNKEIASKLHISERTVKFHVSNLLAKFGVRRRADLILLCYQRRPANS